MSTSAASQTALAVEALTIADMTDALAELDLARATVLMNGPSAELTAAFKALGRRPTYVQPAPPAASAPGTTAPRSRARSSRSTAPSSGPR